MTDHSHRLRRALLATLAIAVLGLGACSGSGSDDEVASGSATESQGGSSSSQDEETTTTEAEELTMPDLLGMTEDEARAELIDLGVDEATISVEEQESLEDAGTIIEQVPSDGTEITGGTISLTVATPIGPMPDFVGQPIAEVREWAEERGLTIRETTVLDDTLAEGEVISTTPEAGQPPSAEIAVEVASLPIVGAIADLEVTQNEGCYNFDTGEASVNGDFLEASLVIQPYRDSDRRCSIEYDFGRDWEQLKGTIGLEDSSDTATKMRLQIYGDEKELLNTVTEFGTSTPLDLDVTGVLRVKIVVTHLAGEDTGLLVLGNLRRIGSPGSVPSTTTTTTP